MRNDEELIGRWRSDYIDNIQTVEMTVIILGFLGAYGGRQSILWNGETSKFIVINNQLAILDGWVIPIKFGYNTDLN